MINFHLVHLHYMIALKILLYKKITSKPLYIYARLMAYKLLKFLTRNKNPLNKARDKKIIFRRVPRTPKAMRFRGCTIEHLNIWTFIVI